MPSHTTQFCYHSAIEPVLRAQCLDTNALFFPVGFLRCQNYSLSFMSVFLVLLKASSLMFPERKVRTVFSVTSLPCIASISLINMLPEVLQTSPVRRLPPNPQQSAASSFSTLLENDFCSLCRLEPDSCRFSLPHPKVLLWCSRAKLSLFHASCTLVYGNHTF